MKNFNNKYIRRKKKERNTKIKKNKNGVRRVIKIKVIIRNRLDL